MSQRDCGMEGAAKRETERGGNGEGRGLDLLRELDRDGQQTDRQTESFPQRARQMSSENSGNVRSSAVLSLILPRDHPKPEAGRHQTTTERGQFPRFLVSLNCRSSRFSCILAIFYNVSKDESVMSGKEISDSLFTSILNLKVLEISVDSKLIVDLKFLLSFSYIYTVDLRESRASQISSTTQNIAQVHEILVDSK